MSALNVSHEKQGQIDIIALDGILNADTCFFLDKVLQPVAGSERPNILINIPKLTYISSAGIGSFIDVIKGVRTKGGDIRFCKMTSKVKRVFDLLDMGDFFKFYDSLDEGLLSYEKEK